MQRQAYLDTEIARLIRETGKNGLNQGIYSVDIRSGVVVIRGERVYFERKPFLNDKVTMILPRDFQEIPVEELYRPEARPDLALANESGSVYISLAHLAKEVADDSAVVAHKNDVRQILQAMNPSIEWLDDSVKDIGGRQVAFFTFVTPMLGTSVYNLSFFLALEHRILTGSFVCGDRELKGWKEVFQQMLASIEVMTTEETTGGALPQQDYSNFTFNQGLYAVYKGKEYRFFEVGEGLYRLISNDERDCADNGFFRQDGVFKKTVDKNEITAAYERKFTLYYQGHVFALGQELKNEVQLIMDDYNYDLIVQLQMQRIGPHVYEKWVAKSEIENAVEKRLPVEGFSMPATTLA